LGNETMPYIINRVLLMKAYVSNFSHLVYIILPSSLFNMKSDMEKFCHLFDGAKKE
jgi:hypothetical protein